MWASWVSQWASRNVVIRVIAPNAPPRAHMDLGEVVGNWASRWRASRCGFRPRENVRM